MFYYCISFCREKQELLHCAAPTAVLDYNKLFKTYMGVTPSKYLTNLRIEQAKRLIEASPRRLSKDIASAVGFSDSLYFSRVFKKETNYSPAEYKRICEQQQV